MLPRAEPRRSTERAGGSLPINTMLRTGVSGLDLAGGPRPDPAVVLLVEDDAADAELIILRLESSGGRRAPPLRLLHARSGSEARATLQLGSVDVIILDLSLPDAQELEALHWMRAAAPGVPIVVLTGMADEAVALDALRAGAQDYVLKPPPDGSTLRRILRYARERQQLLMELDLAGHASAAAARRWRVLAEVGKALATSSQPAEALAEVAVLLVPDAGDAALIYLSGDGDVPSLVEVAHTDAGKVPALREQLHDLLTEMDGGGDRLLRILESGRSADGDDLEAASRSLLDALEMASAGILPLRLRGQVIGLLLLAVVPGRRDGASGVEFGRSIADRISLELERYRLLGETQRAVAARDRTFSIVSHDLGDPLSTIQMCVTALLDPEPPTVGGMRDVAHIIQSSALLMQQIVDDLRDRAGLDAGRLALECEATNVSDVLALMHAMFKRAAKDRRLHFQIEDAADLPSINADPRRLEQALSNLLKNAIKFTPAGGRVVLSAVLVDGDPGEAEASGVSGRAVRFAVSDTGPGIPPEDLSHIFDWFWQSPCGERGGTGLGLAIAKGLVTAHGGRLQVESQPGQGTTFSFSIPTFAKPFPK
jgi:signal transduction histidine kinase/CheY-like chemotaxis protein